MSNQYIVVNAVNADFVKLALGMLGARYLEENYATPYAYPMAGGTLYIWNPRPNGAGDLVAFGPLTTGLDADFGTWCLGKELAVEDAGLTVSITLPTTAQTLDEIWFPPPPPIDTDPDDD